jgi:DNA-binding CsgD family transcriptional regulator
VSEPDNVVTGTTAQDLYEVLQAIPEDQRRALRILVYRGGSSALLSTEAFKVESEFDLLVIDGGGMPRNYLEYHFKKGDPRQSVLTTREREILNWVYHGKSNYEIGAILEISPLTVANHIKKILRKLNVENRTQAVAKAVDLKEFYIPAD